MGDAGRKKKKKREFSVILQCMAGWSPTVIRLLFVILPALRSLEIQQRSLAEGLTVLLNFQS